MKPLFLFIISLILFTACSSEIEKKKPNILFIVADDLGYHDLSCMGSKFYETPNIDRIANEGVIFTNGYAACQVCSPSRASIISGKFPARHGITDWIGAKTGEEWSNSGRHTKLLPPNYEHRLDTSYVTMPEALKEAGYKTFFAGKWHVGGEGSWPEDHGFDINKGGWDVGSPIGGYYAPWENPNLESGPDGESLTIRLARETSEFIKANKDTTFLAYLSFYAVHGPIQTTEEKWGKYRTKANEMGILDHGFEMESRLPIRVVQDNPVYAGLVETMDNAVGIVLKTLEELGLDENTIVVFTSDNGGVASGDNYSTSNLPLRGGKGYQFEGGIREPYFIKSPGLIEPGTKNDAPVSSVDFYPTFLDLAGIELKPDQHSDGMSLLPLLKGHDSPERSLIWHYPHYGNQGGDPSSIIRRGDWKLIHYYENDANVLYNLATDPEEKIDVSLTNAEKTNELYQELMTYLKSVNARFPKPDPNYDPEKASEQQTYRETTLLENLEKQRLDYLSKDFDPGNNWWGSKVTKD